MLEWIASGHISRPNESNRHDPSQSGISIVPASSDHTGKPYRNLHVRRRARLRRLKSPRRKKTQMSSIREDEMKPTSLIAIAFAIACAMLAGTSQSERASLPDPPDQGRGALPRGRRPRFDHPRHRRPHASAAGAALEVIEESAGRRRVDRPAELRRFRSGRIYILRSHRQIADHYAALRPENVRALQDADPGHGIRKRPRRRLRAFFLSGPRHPRCRVDYTEKTRRRH